MTDLSTFARDYNGTDAATIDVIQESFPPGLWQRVNTAAGWFAEDGVASVMVGESQGVDAQRGADDWWPLTVDGADVGELRDTANGLTIYAMGI